MTQILSPALPRFSRSTLPAPADAADQLVVCVETTGEKTLMYSDGDTWVTLASSTPASIGASRDAIDADNGRIRTVSTSLTYTVRSGRMKGFSPTFLLPAGVTLTVATDGVVTINDSTTSVTRANSATQRLVALVYESPNKYTLTGS